MFRANPIDSDGMLTGALVNHCGKGAMAYTLRVTVTFADGKVSIREGMGGDYLLGASAAVLASAAVPGTGVILPGDS